MVIRWLAERRAYYGRHEIYNIMPSKPFAPRLGDFSAIIIYGLLQRSLSYSSNIHLVRLLETAYEMTVWNDSI